MAEENGDFKEVINNLEEEVKKITKGRRKKMNKLKGLRCYLAGPIDDLHGQFPSSFAKVQNIFHYF